MARALFFRRLFALVSCALVLLAVVFSDDFVHPDEHFQTLELAWWKLGGTPYDALPWEVAARMRPWLQPAVYAVVGRVVAGLGGGPFALALVLRAASGALSVVANVVLTRAVGVSVVDVRARTIAVFTLWLGFWVPYLAVRTSSETTSAAFFAMGLGLLVLWRARAGADGAVHLEAHRWLGLGVLFGLAFELRFQSAIMTAGVLAWTFGPGTSGRRREDLRTAALVSAGFGLVVVLGTCLDRWGYGVWTFAPWNYVRANLVEGAASTFGTSPPFAYLWTIHPPALLVVTVPLSVAVVAGWWRGRRHVATWAAVPFFLVHGLLAHKETRFLFPLLGLAAIHVGVALDGFLPVFDDRRLRAALALVLGVDLLACLAAPFALRYPMVDCERFLATAHDRPEDVRLVDDPYAFAEGLSVYVYRPTRGGSERGTWSVAREPVPPALRAGRVVYQTPGWRTGLARLVGGGRAGESWVVVAPR